MDKTVRILSTLSNVLVLGFFLFLLLAGELRFGRGGIEMVIALALFVFPILNLAALYSGPDRETRQLRRALEKARLKKALVDLNEGKTPSEPEKAGCCAH